MTVATTRGYAVLKGTPPDRVAILSAALVKGMQSPRFAAFLRQYGLSVADNVAGSAAWTAQLRRDHAAAAKTLRKLGLVRK